MFNNLFGLFDPPHAYNEPSDNFQNGQYENHRFDMSSFGQALNGISQEYNALNYSYPPFVAGQSFDFGINQESSSDYQYSEVNRQPDSWPTSSIPRTYYGSEESSGFFSALGGLFGIPSSSEDSMYENTNNGINSNSYQPPYGGGYSDSYQPPYGSGYSDFTREEFPRAEQSFEYRSDSPLVSPSRSSPVTQSPDRSSAHVYEVEVLDVKGATSSQIEEWKEITKNVILCVDDHSIIKGAMKNLFILYVASPTFQETVDRLREEGPVNVRTTNASEATFIPIAAHLSNTNDVVLNPSGTYFPNKALACLAFELTNAYFQRDLLAVEEKASTMTAREFGEAIERVEFKTAGRVHEYHMEARELLKKYGFNDPNPWMTSRLNFIHPKVQGVLAKVGIRGKLIPMFRDEKTALSWQRFKGHTKVYEDNHRLRYPQASEE